MRPLTAQFSVSLFLTNYYPHKMASSDKQAYDALKQWITTEKIMNNRSEDYFIRQLIDKGMAPDKASLLVTAIMRDLNAMLKEDPFELNFGKTTLIWFGIAILVVVLFGGLIPFYWYHHHFILNSIFGGALFAFALGKGILNMRTPADYLGEDDKRRLNRHKYSVIMFVPGLIFIFIFMAIDNSRLDTAIFEDGVLTTAIVIDGAQKTSESFSIRRGSQSHTSNELRVSVNLLNGENQTALIHVSGTEFTRSFIDQVKPMVYLPEVEESFKVLDNPTNNWLYKGPRTDSFDEYMENIDFHEKAAGQAGIENYQRQMDERMNRYNY